MAAETDPGRAGRLFLFWDYDTQWGAERSRLRARPQPWGHLEFENTERLLDLLAGHQVPSCFAVVGAAALPGSRPYHDPDQIRRIHGAGHEIASHSQLHEWLPALDPVALRETLRTSKDSLEQCIGAPVRCFVPPYNQPYDFARGGAVSLTERRERGESGTDLYGLCQELYAAGYRTARVFYQPLHRHLLQRLLGRPVDVPGQARRIAGITCVRLNTVCGFLGATLSMLERCARRGGDIVAYGHPHSITSGGPQDERFLVPFLARVRTLCAAGRLRTALPEELIAHDSVGDGLEAVPTPGTP
jgi:peptidoglycan/xylan/chitin deacetylase (PgdA/CDA1 family)